MDTACDASGRQQTVARDPMHDLLPGKDEEVREGGCHGGSMQTCGGNVHTK